MRNSKILEYWNNENVQSMYDRNLLKLEIASISEHLKTDDVVLDAGCGESETTSRYAPKCKSLIATDFSDTRLRLARKNLSGLQNVKLEKVDFTREIPFSENSFDVVISQRFLINIVDRAVQFQIIRSFFNLLKDRGRLLLLEGFNEGTSNLNTLRRKLGLQEIPAKWHNKFFNTNEFEKAVAEIGFRICTQKDFSLYFLLTRVINAKLKHPEVPAWNDELNNIAADLDGAVNLQGLSRLKFYVLEKQEDELQTSRTIVTSASNLSKK